MESGRCRRASGHDDGMRVRVRSRTDQGRRSHRSRTSSANGGPGTRSGTDCDRGPVLTGGGGQRHGCYEGCCPQSHWRSKEKDGGCRRLECPGRDTRVPSGAGSRRLDRQVRTRGRGSRSTTILRDLRLRGLIGPRVGPGVGSHTPEAGVGPSAPTETGVTSVRHTGNGITHRQCTAVETTPRPGSHRRHLGQGKGGGSTQ